MLDESRHIGANLILIAAWVSIHPCFASADRPAWIKENTLQQSGSLLQVVCEATGPSKDLARKFALNNCQSNAADQINGDFKVQSLSLETEKSVNFHSEISSEKKVIGLICVPKAEYAEENDTLYAIWIKCQYDLTRAKVVSIDQKPESAQGLKLDQSVVSNKDQASQLPLSRTPYSAKQIIQSDTRSLSLTTIPRCDSVLIRGKRPRSVACDEMPVTLVVTPEDLEIIIRSSGYLPKHIQLIKRRPSGSAVEGLEVYLEKN